VQTRDQHKSFQDLRNNLLVFVTDQQKRMDIIKQDKLCFNCLGHHKLSQCQLWYRCCGRHHTSLCNTVKQTDCSTTSTPLTLLHKELILLHKEIKQHPTQSLWQLSPPISPSQPRIQLAYWKQQLPQSSPQSQKLKRIFYSMRGLKDPFSLKSSRCSVTPVTPPGKHMFVLVWFQTPSH